MWRDNLKILIDKDKVWKPDLVFINNSGEYKMIDSENQIQIYSGSLKK